MLINIKKRNFDKSLTAVVVSFYVIEYSNLICRKKITVFILQNILYCIQKEFLKRYNKPMFEDDIVAGEYGPYINDIGFRYRLYMGHQIASSFSKINIKFFTKEELSVIEEIVDKYIDFDSKYWYKLYENNNTVWRKIYNQKGPMRILPLKEIKHEREFLINE